MTAQPEEHPSAYVPSQDERTLACISHLSVFVSSIGFLVAIGLWIYLQRRHPYAAFQAGQAVLFQLLVMVLTFFVVGILMVMMFGVFGITLAMSVGNASEAVVGVLFFVLIMAFFAVIAMLTLGMYGYAIYAAVRSYQARPFRIPLVSLLVDLISPMPDVQREEQRT